MIKNLSDQSRLREVIKAASEAIDEVRVEFLVYPEDGEYRDLHDKMRDALDKVDSVHAILFELLTGEELE